VRYLSNTQGLAPAEVAPARFDAERRMISWQYSGDATTNRVCRSCHSMGRALLQRRTRSEWELLVATHRGLYPNSDFQAFRRGGPAPPDSAGAPQPMDVAISHLARTFPLRTPEWTAWTATMRAPNIEGSWFVSGSEAGKGAFFGRTVVTKAAGKDDEFTTRSTLRYAKDGRVVTRTGKSIVYTGFQWRGRSTESPADTGMREVMFIEPGWQSMSGRWYKGGYDEFGMDVSFSRVTGGVMVGGVSRRGLKANAKGQDLTIFGANFPSPMPAGTIDLGPGVRVSSIVRATPDSVVLKVDVDSSAALGARDVFVAGASSRAAVSVYDKVSRIKLTPLAGLARTGGITFPKQYQQFDAVAYSNGPDNKPDTPDDIEIGLVDVTWSLEEYGVTYADDDVKFVGKIDAKGLFTPNVDGPNPLRTGNRNNIGDIWVVATWQLPEAGARPIRARAQLIVTVPLYIRFVPAKTAP
jgi:quinohemoprotein amine dehydrogenase